VLGQGFDERRFLFVESSDDREEEIQKNMGELKCYCDVAAVSRQICERVPQFPEGLSIACPTTK